MVCKRCACGVQVVSQHGTLHLAQVSGHLPKGLGAARLALQRVLADFDTSQITDGLLWALINTWCWDMAAELANNSSQVGQRELGVVTCGL